MTNPTSRLSYISCYEAMDKAREDKRGVRIRFTELSAAQTFRSRLNMARSIDRRDNLVAYKDEPNHPLYGRSVYDTLVSRVKGDDNDNWWVYIEHDSINEMVVESLSIIEAEATEIKAISNTKPKQLPAPKRLDRRA